ncbi:hypothetical protein KOR42_19680 [Thalassoglobus neptunius]|uniref:Uncharacterized protein n=1 Tax=Thalassoglobus neptunius TaxID=1938619 RepID=A0A5C5X6D0_9PLAN|nr:hypothetical protein KOR42_19680 [Thalassoglobus neptunius]
MQSLRLVSFDECFYQGVLGILELISKPVGRATFGNVIESVAVSKPVFDIANS